MPSKKSTKKSFTFTVNLLNLIEQKIPIHSDSPRRDCITKRLGKSKQALNYHLQRFIKLGILIHVQSFPFAIYELTDFGQRVKEILIQCEGVRNLWRCHSLILGFKIKTFGNFQFIDTERRRIIPMNNWKYAMEQIGEFVIHVQDTGLLEIYCPEKYSINPDEAFGKMYAESQAIAQRYCDRYGMILEPMKIIRKAHKSLLKSTKLARVLGKFNLEKVWTDESEGTDELEESQDSYAIERLFELPERLDRIEKHMDSRMELDERLIKTTDQHSKDILLHLKVLKEIGDSVKLLRDSVDNLTKTVNSLNRKA